MDENFVREFMDKFNDDKEKLNKRFDNIDKKIENIDCKFDAFDERMQIIDHKMREAEDIQSFIFGKISGLNGKLENVKVYLSTLETKINEYKTLNIKGQKVHNGELYLLRIKLHKIKPIISWENNRDLESKYREIEEGVLELENIADES